MNLFLAPIQGMTTAFYRNAYAKIFGGIDRYYAPFITTSDAQKVSSSTLKDLLENNDSIVKLIPQLLSNNGADFKLFAHAIADVGYKEINWNIGCPYPMITKKKKGSGILPYPVLIKQFLDIACADSSYTITVKMRLGLEDAQEGMAVMEVLNQYPLGGVIIHPRTGSQMYTGKVNLDLFDVHAKACNHELTYNGDILTFQDFLHVKSRFSYIDNFMLGRGALRNPFLPSEIKGQPVPSTHKMSMIKEFHDEIYNYYKSILSGDKHLCDKMKEFWMYLSVHTDKDGKLMKKIKKCNTATDYLTVVAPILQSPEAWSDSPIWS